MTLKLVVIITNRSLKSCFDFASHWLSIKLQIYCLRISLSKEQKEEKHQRATFDTLLKTVPQIELVFVSLLCNNLPDNLYIYVSICKTMSQ